tara:strand:- start:1697 stop:4696 length:3000 start_codon:yes stop_codon:yes gene_type:complete
MDMKEFFEKVIPPDGWKFLIEIVNDKKHHYPFQTYEDMVDKAAEWLSEGREFYHACASYKELKYNEWGYPVGRTQDNVKFVKSLWQDFDVGKYDKDGNLKSIAYATREEAWEAIKHLMTEVELPRPVLVSSGNGFHTYWPFIESIPPEEWLQIAALARTCYVHLGIKHDTSRDLDVTSILRPVGSFNKTKPVELVRDQEPKSHLYYKELFERYIAKHGITPAVAKTKAAAPGFENEFAGAKVEFPDSSLAVAAEFCNQLKLFKDTGCESEPVWRSCLGVAKHCTDGEELAHEWSAKDPRYTEKETSEKIINWTTGPTKCDTFKLQNPDGCKGCKAKCTSPIQLGYTVETKPPVIIEEEPDGTTHNIMPPFWPNGFSVLDGVIRIGVKNKDGTMDYHRVAAPMFYLAERIRTDDGTYAYTVRMNVKGNQWREFQMPAKFVADIRNAKMLLAAYEITTFNDKYLEHMLQSYSIDARKHAHEVNTFRQFGWNADKTGYLIGDSLITAEGRRPVRVALQTVKSDSLLQCGVVKGTKQEWTDGVNALYNVQHGEPWQYAVCFNAFAGPLIALMDLDDWNGIPLVLTSDTGYGKSTVCKVGINALCDVRKTMLTDSTPASIIGRAGTMNSLPLLMDEVFRSVLEPNDMANICYSLANGRMRTGMKSDGTERNPGLAFKLPCSMTGNKNMFNFLSLNKTLLPEATQMRVFEIALEGYPRMASLIDGSAIHTQHMEIALHIIDNVHGVWADDYFKFLFENMEMVKAKLKDTALAIIKAFPGNATSIRFFAYHAACTLVGGWIGRKIGAHAFNLTVLRDWSFEHMKRLRVDASKYTENIEEQFSNMLADLHGTVLVTRHFDLLDSKSGNIEVPMVQIRGPITARLVLGSDRERGKLYVSVKAMDEWCSKKNLSPLKFRRMLTGSNILRQSADKPRYDEKISISKGVPSHPMGRCRCVEVDYSVAQGYVEEFVNTSNVVPFTGLPTSAASSPVSPQSTGTSGGSGAADV